MFSAVHPSEKPYVKVCGVRETSNIKEVDALGVDFIGFIFYEKSPRNANAMVPLAFNVPTHAKRVGVFVNAKPTQIKSLALLWGLDYIQLHGDETPEEVRAVANLIHLPIWKAFRINDDFNFEFIQYYHDLVDAFVFDAAGHWYGGNGKPYDWTLLNQYQGPTPFWLSGGIGPKSPPELEGFKHPYCIGYDVNSKFEVVPGRKNPERLKSFLQAVKYRHLLPTDQPASSDSPSS